MSKFKRYTSIENHYREKNITDMLKFNPVYHSCTYVATEKIHGANFQIKFIKHLESGAITIAYGKRSGWLVGGEKFYNYLPIVQRPHIIKLQDFVMAEMHARELTEVVLYGEFYGGNIQAGVNYGPEKDFIFFDVSIDEDMLSTKSFYNFMNVINASSLTVPIVGHFDSIDEAIRFEVENRITIVGAQEEGNGWEGVVIKPWDVIARNKDDEQVLFYVKKKSEAFKDRESVKKSKNKSKDIPQELQTAQDIFASYLTEHRLHGVFGKEGMITEDKQFGQYIKFMMEDAKEDFLKDEIVVFNEVPDKYKGKIFSVTGKIVAPMLMKYV